MDAQILDTLNLPMRKRRGFQTPDHSWSRGPFRPRAGSRIAPTPGARVQHLSTDTTSRKPRLIRMVLVLTEKSTCPVTTVLP